MKLFSLNIVDVLKQNGFVIFYIIKNFFFFFFFLSSNNNMREIKIIEITINFNKNQN